MPSLRFWIRTSTGTRSLSGRQSRFDPTAFHRCDDPGRVVDSLRKEPDPRRHIVSARNAAALTGKALPCCHALFRVYLPRRKHTAPES
ncbi:thymidylate synthase [Microbacterium halotolerans]|uniref:thymidylate synthase n=1 Tax=Microbacterium halotolerans TaxID=246613 RepID=UPI000E6AA0D1